MRKCILIFVLVFCLIASPAFALYVTTNTANTAWPGSTTLQVGETSTSDYIQVGGCQYALLTVGSGTVTAEAIAYFTSGSTALTTEVFTAGTPFQLKSSRYKFRLYGITAVTTPEAFVYCY